MSKMLCVKTMEFKMLLFHVSSQNWPSRGRMKLTDGYLLHYVMQAIVNFTSIKLML